MEKEDFQILCEKNYKQHESDHYNLLCKQFHLLAECSEEVIEPEELALLTETMINLFKLLWR